jgi:hypothetical protein
VVKTETEREGESERERERVEERYGEKKQTTKKRQLILSSDENINARRSFLAFLKKFKEKVIEGQSNS